MLTDTILRNRYKILKELGRGGFSVTYLAVDMDLPGNPKCVVKQLKTRHSNNTILQIAKKLFDREAQVLYRLGKGHKQIPEMFAHFEENDEFYLVQEFVDGHDLTKEIKPRHRLSEEKVIKLLQEILEVLSFVHENNVIHRDIKLRNIMRRREDGKIVLIDFGAVKEIKGLAKNQQGDVNSTLIIGTPGYMPDEQANGKPRLCSDIYAVGMLGIQALTGLSPRELPFNPDNGELIWRDSAKVSDLLAEVLTGMVRHHFSQRYQTAAEALTALKSPVTILPKTSSAYDATPVTLPSNVRKSHLSVVQSLGLVGLMGVGFGLGIFGWNFAQSSSNTNEANSTKQLQKTPIKSATPSATPVSTENKSARNQNQPIFLPSPPKVAGNKNQPIFRPFIPPFFFNNNKVQVNPATPQSKESPKKKPIKQKAKPTPKPPIIKEEPQKTDPLPKISTPKPPISIPTPNKKTEPSIPSISIPTPDKETEVNSLPTTPPEEVIENKQNPTSLPTTPPVDNSNPTSLPSESEIEAKENEEEKPEDISSDATSTSTPESVDDGKQQPSDVPDIPDTPAIEDESPKPTPSPIPTTGSVVVPTPQETPVAEENSINYFNPLPTLAIPTPEAEAQPVLSPQPTPTQSQSPSSASPTEAETQPTPEASLSPTPEESPQPTPQASLSPTPEESPQPTQSPVPETEVEVIPQTESPIPETEVEVIPQTESSIPETEVEVIPQAVYPLPEIVTATPPAAFPLPEVEAVPTPTPVETPGLSLERFKI